MGLKVIFLDVDGELTYETYVNKITYNIDIEKVKLLKDLCDITNAKVVISSSWRPEASKGYVSRGYVRLREILEEFGICVLGDTPIIESRVVGGIPSILSLDEVEKVEIEYGTGRGAEISKWLSDNGDVEAFVILDDEDFDWQRYGLDKNWIQPTWYGDGGLKREHVEEAIKILNFK